MKRLVTVLILFKSRVLPLLRLFIPGEGGAHGQFLVGFIGLATVCGSVAFVSLKPHEKFFQLTMAGVEFKGRGDYRGPAGEYSCGMVNGHAFRVSSSYVFLWPKFYFDVNESGDRVFTQQTCQSVLKVLPLAIGWPDMLPHLGGFYPPATELDKGIRIIIRPEMSPKLSLYLSLASRLGEGFSKLMEQGREVSPGLRMSRGRTDAGEPVAVYWTDFNGDDPLLIVCMWSSVYRSIYLCEGSFGLESKGTRVDVIFSPEKLADWQSVIMSSRNFVNDIFK